MSFYGQRSQSLDQIAFAKRKRSSSYDIEDIEEDNRKQLKFTKFYVDTGDDYALKEPKKGIRVNGRIYLRPYASVKDIFEVLDVRRFPAPSSPTHFPQEEIVNTPPDRSDSRIGSSRKRLRRASDQSQELDGWSCSECTMMNPMSEKRYQYLISYVIHCI